MICNKQSRIPDPTPSEMVRLIRCCPEVKDCAGNGADPGACESLAMNEAQFYLDAGTHVIALWARLMPGSMPKVYGAVGEAGIDVTVTLELPDDSELVYTATSDESGNWMVDTATADAAPAEGETEPQMLAADALSEGDAISVTVTATVGDCGELSKELTGTAPGAMGSC